MNTDLIHLNDGTELDARQTLAVHLHVQGQLNSEQIAEEAGYANTQSLNVFLRSDKGRAGVLVAATQRLSSLTAAAVDTQAKLLNAKSEKVRADVAEAILQRAERLGMLGTRRPDEGGDSHRNRGVNVTINLPHVPGDDARVIPAEVSGDD